jgi:hypothetical protein
MIDLAGTRTAVITKFRQRAAVLLAPCHGLASGRNGFGGFAFAFRPGWQD